MNEKCFNNCKELVLFYDASNPRNKYAIDWTDIKWDGIACPVDDVQCDKQCQKYFYELKEEDFLNLLLQQTDSHVRSVLKQRWERRRDS